MLALEKSGGVQASSQFGGVAAGLWCDGCAYLGCGGGVLGFTCGCEEDGGWDMGLVGKAGLNSFSFSLEAAHKFQSLLNRLVSTNR